MQNIAIENWWFGDKLRKVVGIPLVGNMTLKKKKNKNAITIILNSLNQDPQISIQLTSQISENEGAIILSHGDTLKIFTTRVLKMKQEDLEPVTDMRLIKKEIFEDVFEEVWEAGCIYYKNEEKKTYHHECKSCFFKRCCHDITTKRKCKRCGTQHCDLCREDTNMCVATVKPKHMCLL